jgi:hypothetical protein
VTRWPVTVGNGENRIEAAEAAQAEAWHRACEQARAVGMLAPLRARLTPAEGPRLRLGPHDRGGRAGGAGGSGGLVGVKVLRGTAGSALGEAVLRLLPYALVPHTHEFDGFVYLAAWVVGDPRAARIGLVVGLAAGARMGREKPPG